MKRDFLQNERYSLGNKSLLPKTLEKFIISSTVDTLTKAVTVEISRIWLSTSFMLSSVFQTVVAAKAWQLYREERHV